MTKLNAAGSALVYSTVVGGSSGEGAAGVALDASNNVRISGSTSSVDFPVSPDAFDSSFNGDREIFWGDGFVAKIGAGATPPPTPPGVPAAPPLELPLNGDNPPPPITFHWDFATNAVAYQIHIDDSGTFSARSCAISRTSV